MLTLEAVHAGYGVIPVLRGVSLDVQEGETVALVGPNGAGKTTLMRVLTGALRARSGRMHYCGQALDGMRPDAIVAAGVSLVPEGRRVFAPLSVTDNLTLGAYLRLRRGDRRAVADDLEAVFARFPRLKARASEPAGALSGGEQQMLAIGRALMARPRLMLLDEPSMGLAPRIVGEVFRFIAELNRSGTTVLLAEQNVRMALKIAHRVHVIESGRVTRSGTAGALADDPAIIAAYLGAAAPTRHPESTT